jgi:hypothetical protein
MPEAPENLYFRAKREKFFKHFGIGSLLVSVFCFLALAGIGFLSDGPGNHLLAKALLICFFAATIAAATTAAIYTLARKGTDRPTEPSGERLRWHTKLHQCEWGFTAETRRAQGKEGTNR